MPVAGGRPWRDCLEGGQYLVGAQLGAEDLAQTGFAKWPGKSFLDLVTDESQAKAKELIADAMLIIDKGKKRVEGKVSDLFDPAETIVELQTADDELSLQQIKESPFAHYLKEQREDCILLQMHKKDIPAAMKALMDMGLPVISFNSRYSLEDYFLSITTGKPYVETTAD